MNNNTSSSMSFNERFRYLLDDKKTSINKVAKAIDVAPTALRRYTKEGFPNLETASKLAEYFSVSLDFLATGKECELDKHVFSMEGLTEKSLEELNRYGKGEFSSFYINSKILCPSYCTERNNGASIRDSTRDHVKKIIERYENKNNNDLKTEMMFITLNRLIQEKRLLETISLYLFSTDTWLFQQMSEQGTMLNYGQTEPMLLGKLIYDIDQFKFGYYYLSNLSLTNKTNMFLEGL